MAVLTFNQAAKMQLASVWYGNVSSYDSSHITITDYNGDTGTYYGSFNYNATGLSGGAVTGYDSYSHYAIDYTVRDVSLDALTVNNFLNTGNAIGLQQYALSGNDIITGTSGNDVLLGWGGNDVFYGNGGNDTIDGGEGFNTIVLPGKEAFYTITPNSTGFVIKSFVNVDGTLPVTLYQWAPITPNNPSGQSTFTWSTLTDSNYTGGGGWSTYVQSNPGTPGLQLWEAIKNVPSNTNDATTVLDWTSGYYLSIAGSNSATGISITETNIQQVKFSDHTLTIDSTPNVNLLESYRIYKAAFDRAPDYGGLGFWYNAMSHGGASLSDVAGEFIKSTEFKAMYGDNSTDSNFLTLLYQHVLGRTPDQGGFDFWITALHTDTRANVLVQFSESGENIANVAGVVSHGIIYEAYTG